MVHVGVAPQAQLVGVKVLDSGGSGSFATVMAGMEWTVEKKHVFNIRAASMSLGGPGAIEWTTSEEESVNFFKGRFSESVVGKKVAEHLSETLKIESIGKSSNILKETKSVGIEVVKTKI